MPRTSQGSRWQVMLMVVTSLGVVAAPAMGLPVQRGVGVEAADGTVPPVGAVTADPPVARPATTPCTVTLFKTVQFADFTPKTFDYTPPAACPGPWAKVVLVADFSVSAGRQFDRTAEIAIGHTNVYYGTTPEPSSTVSPSWHVERDLTDYSALLRSAQAGDANIGNLVNDTYTGVITGSASLQFYPATRAVPAPRTPDVVLPLSDAPGGAAQLSKTTDLLAPDLTLPSNIEAAYLDVVAQSQSDDEFWYTCVPDDVSNELQSCGGTAFREVEVTVDGTPAGIAPVYPWIFTGGIDPLLWRPIPGVQTLDFVPFRVDLTPFAALLNAAGTHRVGVQVFNSNNYFNVAATLLLDLDAGSRQVSGGLTVNTLAAAPAPTVTEALDTDAQGNIAGSVKTASARHFTLSGFVNTAHGRIVTRVDQEVDFTNDQNFDVTAASFAQAIHQNTAINTSTSTRQGGVARLTATRLSYPLNLEILVNINADGSGTQTTTVAQTYDRHDLETDGSQISGTVTNTVQSHDTLLFDASGNITGYRDRASGQSYFAQSTGGGCYSLALTSQNGLLTSTTSGKACRRH